MWESHMIMIFDSYPRIKIRWSSIGNFEILLGVIINISSLEAWRREGHNALLLMTPCQNFTSSLTNLKLRIPLVETNDMQYKTTLLSFHSSSKDRNCIHITRNCISWDSNAKEKVFFENHIHQPNLNAISSMNAGNVLELHSSSWMKFSSWSM